MKKIKTSRGVAILLCLCMALAVLVGALTIPVRATAGNSTVTEQELLEAEHPDALHFYIRHWHDKEDSRTALQGAEQQSGDRYFVVAEGYIVPLAESDDRYIKGETEYTFYLVYQSGSEEGDGALRKIDDGGDDDNFVNGTDYIEAVDAATGSITLKASPVPEWDEDGGVLKNEDGGVVSTERFSAFSISAGHDAVTYGPANGFTEDTLTITYDKYVHLVKGHVFYISDVMDVAGTNDSRVFGIKGTDELEDPEVDTVEIWAYAKDIVDNGGEVLHAKGSFVEDSSTDPAGLFGSAYTAAEVAQATGIDKSNLKLTKFYSTTEGLHTDKTAAVVGDDGRTFDVTLETWYTEKHPANVGMVLDASGSMIYASDKPTAININDILTPEEIEALGITQLTSANSGSGWDTFFLTEDQLKSILNPNYTDNSALAAGDYNYFVWNSTEGYVPLGYWDGTKPGTQTPANSAFTFAVDEDAEVIYGWPTSNSDLSFSGSYGLNSSTNKSGVTATSTNGILLDVVPTSGSFTVSFIVSNSSSDSNTNDIVPLLYIGPMSGNTGAGNFYNVYRDSGGSSNYLRGNQKLGSGDNLTSFNTNVFNSTNTKYRVTLVFENAGEAGGTVTSYISNTNGAGIAQTNSQVGLDTPITEYNIIINGFRNAYNGSAINIDEVYVIDRALTQTDVQSSLHIATPNYTQDLIGKYTFTNNSNLYTNDGRDWLLNSVKEDQRGDPSAYAKKLTGQQYVVTTIQNDTAVTADGRILGKFRYGNSAGWYYISHTGAVSSGLYVYGTGKQLSGVYNSGSVSDTVTQPSGNEIADPKNTGKGYTGANTPVRFYVDADGYLRCFFSASTSATLSSYVYELTDRQYIRTETLQRAIGSFVTELEQKSPDAWVSAVRFSTDTLSSKELLIQKWTSDSGVSAQMLALRRNGGGIAAEDGQYNYFLTGSTKTYKGLEAFIDNLAELPEEREGGRFLILFTDGADSDAITNGVYDEKNNTSLQYAEQLKKDYNYTIFTVLLDGGTMDDAQYQAAHQFLLSLSGSKTSDAAERETYFFSVQKAKENMMLEHALETFDKYKDLTEEQKSAITYASLTDGEKKTLNDWLDTQSYNESDILTQIFSKDILDQVAEDRIDYTVQDYIDPRFDLVDGDGVTWYLKAGGEVKLKDKEGKETTTTVGDEGVKFTLKGASTQTVGDTAYLFYDADVDMYYLEWLKQRIPACAIGSSELSVWSATFTLKAKEDFIGGNDVLTNGNKEYMNWVYYPDDAGKDANGNPNYSSGTDDMRVEYEGDTNIIADHPSKGFPRVTVNVALLGLSGITSSENRIYLGEVIDPMEAIKQLGDTLDRDDYWVDYLRRYAPIYAEEHGLQGAENMTADELLDYLLEELIKRPNDWGFDIPYYYLADPMDPTSQAGLADQQQSDQLGILHYRWERIDPDSGQVIGVGGYGAGSSSPSRGEVYETLDTRRVEYRLVISYWPFPDKNDDFWRGLDTWQAGQTEKVQNGETVEFATVTDFLDALRDGLDGKGGLSSAVQSASSGDDLDEIIATLEGFMGDAPTAALEEEQFAQHRKDILYHLFGSEDGPEGDVDEDYESLVKLFGELAELRSELAGATDSEERANLQAKIAQKESELDAKKSEVDVLIQDMVNYVNYLRWCYGYEETTDPVTDVSSGGYTDGSKKFNSRAKENDELIISDVKASDGTVLKAGDNAYLTPKPPVGDAQYNRVANGNLLTRVVRGELAFEMEFQLFELDYLFSQFWTDRTEMTYTVNVERTYDPELPESAYKDGNWLDGLTIPDLTITIKPEDIAKLKDPEIYPGEVKVDGGVVTLYYETTYTDGPSKYLYPKAIYNQKTGDVTFYSDPTVFDPAAYAEKFGIYNKYARLLPIGTYKLTPDTEANSAAGWDVFNFGDGLLYAPQTDYTFNDWHFTRTEDGTEPTNTTDSVYFPRSEASLNYGFGQIYAPAANWATVTDAEGNTSYDPKGTLADKDGGVVFLLGTALATDENGDPVLDEDKNPVRVDDYTDDRVGMAKLTASLKYLLPATGGSGTTVFYASGAALLLVGSLCLVCLDPRTRRTRRQTGTRS